ncbi:MAG: T9SS type A sorting domain-containing protein, partial [Bacteroidota bacterium]
STIDENPYGGFSYYRLAQTDFDGTVNYSDIVSAFMKELVSLDQIVMYPNPTLGIINVKSLSQVEYKLINVYGQLIQQGTILNEQLDISALANGVYYLEMTTEYGEEVRKVLKQ